MRSAPRYVFLLMIQPCTLPWKLRMMVQHFKVTWTYYRCGKLGGKWNSTSRSARLYTKRPVKRDYILHGQVLESVTCAKYLGVDISGSLTWNSHIDRITGSANRTLGFMRRDIKTKMPKVRETAYNTLVRPQLEYASAVWDPQTKKQISQIEQVKRRAARWTVSNFAV